GYDKIEVWKYPCFAAVIAARTHVEMRCRRLASRRHSFIGYRNEKDYARREEQTWRNFSAPLPTALRSCSTPCISTIWQTLRSSPLLFITPSSSCAKPGRRRW